jgi:hypothetical protein
MAKSISNLKEDGNLLPSRPNNFGYFLKTKILIAFSVVVCAGMVFALMFQRRELVNLKGELHAKMVSNSTLSEAAPAFTDKPLIASAPVSRELLQLRNQVGQLRRRRAELESVQAEHERLTNEVAVRATNGMALPSDYIRKSDARLAGYTSPEATIQSFLYALRNRETNSLLHALATQEDSALQSQKEQNIVEIFEGGKSLFGLRIVRQHQNRPDYIEAQVEVVPGSPPAPINFRLENGEWKMDIFR